MTSKNANYSIEKYLSSKKNNEKLEKMFLNEHQKMIKRLVIAFDLDGTLIDSSHRSGYREDGKFYLEDWVAKSTWEYIQKDTLLPLYHLYHAYKEAGFTVIAVTARELREGDYRYFEQNNLNFDFILSREDSKQLDHELKNGKLAEFLSEENRIPHLFYDDKDDNLEVARKYGFSPMKAQYHNLKAVVKDFHSIRNINEGIEEFKPKQSDMAKTTLWKHVAVKE